MKLSPEELKKLVVNKTDAELYDMLYIHANDYTPDVLRFAEIEFRFRKVESPNLVENGSPVGQLLKFEQEKSFLAELDITADELVKREEEPLEWYLKVIFSLVVAPGFLLLPVIQSYYTKRGFKRKARECLKWTICGWGLFIIWLVVKFFL